MRSPAVPASSLALSAALYSVGAVGANFTVMSGCVFSNAGMIFSCQIARSSLRQLSIVSVTGAAYAALAPARIALDMRKPKMALVQLIANCLPLAGRRPSRNQDPTAAAVHVPAGCRTQESPPLGGWVGDRASTVVRARDHGAVVSGRIRIGRCRDAGTVARRG